MAYINKVQLLDPKRYKYTHPTTKATVWKSGYTMKPKFITVHNTYNDASAQQEATYHNRADNHNSTSFHIAVDNIEVIQLLPFDRNGYHCGDGSVEHGGNRNSIGVEICYSKSGGQRYYDAEENAANYIAHLCIQFGLTHEDLRQHYYWSKKDCPHRIRAEGRWVAFVNKVASYINLIKNPTPVEPPKPPTPSEIHGVTDVDGHYYAPYIFKALDLGLMYKATNTTFNPDAPITRGEMALIITTYYDKDTK